MSTKRTHATIRTQSPKPLSKRTLPQPPPGRGFARRLHGTIALLLVLGGVLTAANFAQEPRPNSTSALERQSGTTGFEIYTLQRETGFDDAGNKKPDTIRGANINEKGDGTVMASAPRIQEFAALPTALTAVTVNGNSTSSLEIIPFAGGPATQIPLPEPGTVEQLQTGSKHFVGFAFSSATPSQKHWKTLFVYNIDDPSTPPQAIHGLDGKPVSVWNWTFVPGTTSLVVQTDARAMFLADALNDGNPTPLGLHAEMLGFIPGTKELHVADGSSDPATKRAKDSSIDLTDGTVKPLNLREVIRNDQSYPDTTVVLDGTGRYAQTISKTTAGKVSSFITVTGAEGSNTFYTPEPAWSRIVDFCVSRDGNYLAVETAAPEGISDQYANLPAYSPMRTELVDVKTGASAGRLPGFLPSWCR